jgi:hypothetical protein
LTKKVGARILMAATAKNGGHGMDSGYERLRFCHLPKQSQ